MESSRCKAFLASVENGSFSKAAEALNYTPSGVSQLVNAFEADIGFPLLIRDKKGVRPTNDGLRILAAVREFLMQEEYIFQLASEIKGLITGEITIGTYSSIATHLLPGLIKQFQTNFPDITIHIMEGIREEITRWLDNREIDIAFLSYKAPMEYKWISLYDDPMIAVLPPDHPLANQKAYPLEKCQEENFIMPGLGRDVDIIEMLQCNGLTPTIAFSTLENFTALAMIEQGLGMSIMNELITKNWKADIVYLPVDPLQVVSLGIAVHSLQKISPAAKRFVNYCISAFV
ncbi:HTH-type transcriptional regulator GltC [Sporomusa ovata DSM 2662]|uniref:LysR family transcriptional regulator STM2281 n=1 Tax=Sporomusa ovata TaxID=2378 RepID=A0A0U1KVI6_9FIRM|nr:LysR family transcriptional regulator [Sporomusa ovata]EQB28621.1 transcriptional regulator [Sporomusa ovata DSM 2662]CQR71391.1 LysR family transcriptional regulator STM2281 [Sporomusa ovata]